MNIRRKRPVYDSLPKNAASAASRWAIVSSVMKVTAPTIIEITAIGEKSILAKAVSHDGETVERNETLWTLNLPRLGKGVGVTSFTYSP